MHAADLSPPPWYRAPSTPLSRRTVAILFRMMFGTATELQADGTIVISAGSERYVISPPSWAAALRILVHPTVEVGEQYMRGAWALQEGDLADFLRFCQQHTAPRFLNYYFSLGHRIRVRHALKQFIMTRRATRKVRSHYEIDSEIYACFLDPEMLYTCAFFDQPDMTLEEAQRHKVEVTSARMRVPERDGRVLDIGCGWGGMGRHLVLKNDSVQVTGLTLSAEQIRWTKMRNEAVLTPEQRVRANTLREDYLDHAQENYYDSVVAIGVMEHVGLGDYRTFLAHIAKALKPGGTAVIHTIVCERGGLPTNGWIDRYIFPGGYAPSIAEVLAAAEGTLRVDDIHVHGPSHYWRTIDYWKAKFLVNVPRVKAHLKSKGHSEQHADSFIRMLHFYLSSVRSMFEEDMLQHQIVQFVLRKPADGC